MHPSANALNKHLIRAIEAMDEQGVKNALEAGADPHYRDRHYHPLLTAASLNSPAIVDMLWVAKATFNHTSGHSAQPYLAAYNFTTSLLAQDPDLKGAARLHSILEGEVTPTRASIEKDYGIDFQPYRPPFPSALKLKQEHPNTKPGPKTRIVTEQKAPAQETPSIQNMGQEALNTMMLQGLLLHRFNQFKEALRLGADPDAQFNKPGTRGQSMVSRTFNIKDGNPYLACLLEAGATLGEEYPGGHTPLGHATIIEHHDNLDIGHTHVPEKRARIDLLMVAGARLNSGDQALIASHRDDQDGSSRRSYTEQVQSGQAPMPTQATLFERYGIEFDPAKREAALKMREEKAKGRTDGKIIDGSFGASGPGYAVG